MVSPAQKVRLVRENLALAMAIWMAAKNGHIGPSELTGHKIENSENELGSPLNALNLVQKDALTRSTGNQVRASFALSVTQTQQSLDSVFSVDPLDEEVSDLRAARSAIYLMNSAVVADMFSPVWDCPPRYRSLFEVRPIRFMLDAKDIQGRVLNWDNFGGLDKFLCLLDYCKAWVEQPRDPRPATVPAVEKVQNALRHRSLFDQVVATAADSVEAFISSRCELGEGFRSTAKDLYVSYVGWCKDTDQQPVTQRSFGMRLTGQGLERRRRGRGKHWWEGIKVVGVPELAITERRNGVH